MTANLQSKARELMAGHGRNIKKRQQALLTRSAASIGLDADEYWGRIQGKVHPSFRAAYDRAGATLS